MDSVLLLSAWLLATPTPVETRFERLAPGPVAAMDGAESPRRSPGIGRAVVLLHGLRLQPVSEEAVRRAEPCYWEKPEAPVVKALSAEADVYAFHYAQSIPLDDVARTPDLYRAIRSLCEAGYPEVVLVGYSAGGVIARQFVEDQPHGGGVTKVVQVCAPNGGSEWTVLSHGVRSAQVPFIRSLTKESRSAANNLRGEKRVPDEVEFVCLVAVCTWKGDGIVRRDCQWTPDLQKQGIRAETIFVQHIGAMYSSRLASKVAELVRTPQPRWTSEQVAAAKPEILGWLASSKRKAQPVLSDE
ncbi:MAG: esterase/lipase family protein [Gemmataceae bacterium]